MQKERALRNLERVGQDLGYKPVRGFRYKETKHVFDLCMLKDKKLAVVIDIGRRNAMVASLLTQLGCKYLVFSGHVAESLGTEEFKQIVEYSASEECVNRKSLGRLLVLPKILEYVERTPNTHLREIARELGLHPQVVGRWLIRASKFLEFKPLRIGDALPNLPVLVKLKPTYTVRQVLSLIKKEKSKANGKSLIKKASKVEEKKSIESRGMNKQAKLLTILKFIEQNPGTCLREIARALRLNPAVVHRSLREVQNFLVFQPISQQLDLTSANLPVMIRLKEGVTPEGIMRYLRVREKLKGV